jgi:predicted  nucleic acid-binding Zn-ribbon protein
MKTEQIIKTLRDHNDWRRGVGKWDNGEKANYFDTMSAYELGQTIDAAIERLQALEKELNYALGQVEGYEKANKMLTKTHINTIRDLLPWEKGNE